MNTLKLYRGSDIIGVVTDPEQEGPETIAGLELTEGAKKWKDLLDYIMCPKDPTQDPPFDYDIFDEWFVEDENGNRRPIQIPGIFDGGTNLSWRWKR
jgi:hypothetical protein